MPVYADPMSDFLGAWQLSRGRFLDSFKTMSAAQINWRMHPGTLTIAEMALHVAGVEVSFSSQLTGADLDPAQARLKSAATEGVVNENPFPYRVEEMTPEAVAEAMALGEAAIRPLLENPGPYRDKPLKSALGPMIDGNGAFARLCFHAGYHQGQVHFIATAPGFPEA